MRHYCTLADYAYLPKLLAMYKSLLKHSSEPFMLHVLPMDDGCEWALRKLALPAVRVVERNHFVFSMGLSEIQRTRTRAEFCWTCASNFCEWLLMQLPEITYLDADLFFFSAPAPVFNEIGDRSIAITPHRLIPSKRYLEVNGLFNVGWVTFRDTEAGQACVTEWARQCREWCFNRIEDGKFGDQKYLDEWPAKYGSEVCQLGIGVNVAPWNIGQWSLTEGPTVDGVPVVCYHMHEFEDGERNGFRHILLTNYDLRDADRRLIYGPYLTAYEEARDRVRNVSMQLQSERA